MSNIAKVADVLKNFSKYRKESVGKGQRGGGGTWAGLKHIKNADHERIAVRLLETSWDQQKAVASLFQMAQSIEQLLCIRISWLERFHLGRVLISALTYSGLYYLDRDSEDDFSPFYIIASGKTLDATGRPVHRTQSGKPFPKWTAPFDNHGNQLVRSSRPCPPELEYEPWIPDDDTPLPWLEAVHKLESVGYRINQELLKWAIKSDKKKSTRIIPKKWDDYDKRKTALDARYKTDGIAKLKKKVVKKVSKTGKSKGLHLKEFTVDEKKVWNSYWREHYFIHQKKDRYESRRANFERERDTAIGLGKKGTFYQRVSMDYRGRLYLPEFSYQGSDFCRAVIEFASGSVIDDQGYWHLHRHIANVSGKGGDVQEKIDLTHRESVANIGIALDPITNIAAWVNADKPFCFLRACMELRDVTTPKFRQFKETPKFNKAPKEHQEWVNSLLTRHDDLELVDTKQHGEQFLSHLPIELDQSSSAFQHIAQMMNDDELRRRSNMEGEFSDPYAGIAERLKIDAEYGERRKIVKRVAVPWGYGASAKTCRKRLRKYRDESEKNTPYLESLTNQEVGQLADKVVRMLKKDFQTCVDFTDRVKDGVEAVRNRGQDFVTWYTPSFFIVRQRVHTASRPRGDVWSGEKDVEVRAKRPTDTIDWQSNRTKAPPNLVHSYDATLIHGVLWAGQFSATWPVDSLPYMTPQNEGRLDDMSKPHEIHYPVITIHDAFSCHANNCQDLQHKLTIGLGALYSGFDPLQLFLWMTEGGEYSRRNIDFDWVNRSRNAFT